MRTPSKTTTMPRALLGQATGHREGAVGEGEGVSATSPQRRPDGGVSTLLTEPCVADTVHDRLESLAEKGRHPTHFQGKRLVRAAERPRRHQRPPLRSAGSFTVIEHSHPAPVKRERAEDCQIEQAGGELSRSPSRVAPRLRGRGAPSPEGAGAGEPGDQSFGRGLRPGLLGRGCSRFGDEVGGKREEATVQVHGPRPPPSPTLTSSVSRRGISMEPRDMVRSEDERASRPAAPQPVLLASGSSRGWRPFGSGGDCRPAAPPELGLLLPVSRLNNEQPSASDHFRQPRPLPRKHSPPAGPRAPPRP